MGAQLILCCTLPDLRREGTAGSHTPGPPPAALLQLLAPTGPSPPAAPAPVPRVLGRLLPCSCLPPADTMHRLLLALPGPSSVALLRRLPAMLGVIQLPKGDEGVPSSDDRWRMGRVGESRTLSCWRTTYT